MDTILVVKHGEMLLGPIDLDDLCVRTRAICWENNLGGHLLLTTKGRCRQSLRLNFLLLVDSPGLAWPLLRYGLRQKRVSSRLVQFQDTLRD